VIARDRLLRGHDLRKRLGLSFYLKKLENLLLGEVQNTHTWRGVEYLFLKRLEYLLLREV